MQNKRCVMILNAALPPGKATNAAAVMALTLGQRHPALVGNNLEDAEKRSSPGFITTGIPVLAATDEQLTILREQCEQAECDLVLFPEAGQSTTDYQALGDVLRQQPRQQWRLSGLAMVGDKKALRKLTAKLALFS
ncbi:DUF2000 domain-containing protein [Pantoea sp. Bo_2]|uniref:DUF2000 domain-containing protein n=1 Tax=Candidatus Pantoea gossypiicola TaxID=2608008 RepID=A0AB34CML7_9GAMM|nr:MULTISPECIES: DUF2000 domain-containing protein [Pantoea]KAA5929302.1 DUF2000 domain-containing protein [Pantoea sp. VH_8]KAA5934555.1 DUF2000 domain-containing protein [Pantoea sp. VH_4]KAA5950975.1 DUF2000 domain-containing protein [Pantoea sp. VH_3]KAA5956323.1 DUF2000 domain-containing protein [Pantoea sp. VH_25]KAA5959343.1 DUF2000 domain-containing protein [Pantoea sp. VH_24]